MAPIGVLRTSRNMKKDCGEQGCPNDHPGLGTGPGNEVIEYAQLNGPLADFAAVNPDVRFRR